MEKMIEKLGEHYSVSKEDDLYILRKTFSNKEELKSFYFCHYDLIEKIDSEPIDFVLMFKFINDDIFIVENHFSDSRQIIYHNNSSFFHWTIKQQLLKDIDYPLSHTHFNWDEKFLETKSVALPENLYGNKLIQKPLIYPYIAVNSNEYTAHSVCIYEDKNEDTFSIYVTKAGKYFIGSDFKNFYHTFSEAFLALENKFKGNRVRNIFI